MSIRVLVVEDEPDVLRLLEFKLAKAGFEVLRARDGEDGLARAISEQPDVVLMDVMMPKMDGLTVVAAIRAHLQPGPLILMLTARGQAHDIAQGLAHGADGYIAKPFAPHELIERIHQGLVTRAQ